MTVLTFMGLLATAAAARRAWAVQRATRARRRLAVPAEPRALRRSGGDSPAWFGVALESAGFGSIDAARAWRVWTVGATAVASVAAVVLGPVAGVVLAGAVVIAPLAVLWSMRDRGATVYEAMLPSILDDVGAGLRSGASLLVALESAAARAPVEVCADITILVDAVGQGSSFADELDGWVERRPLRSVQLAAAALAVGLSTGGRQARAVESVGATLRERSAVRAEAVALATQSRASAMVMSVIPLVFAAAAATLDPRVGHVLLRTPLGLACLTGGLTLDGIAGLWMARITRGAR